MTLDNGVSHPRHLAGLSHFLYAASENRPDKAWHIAAVIEVSGIIEREALVDLLFERVVKSCPQLRSVVYGDRYSSYKLNDLGSDWRPSELVSVRLLELSDRELECELEDMIQKPFLAGLPEWEFVIFQGADKCKIACRFNHSLLDGFSMVQILLSLTEKEDVVEPPQISKTCKERGFAGNFLCQVWRNFCFILRLIFGGFFVVYNILIFPLLRDSRSSFAPYGDGRGKNSLRFLPEISVDTLRKVAKSADPNATVNDALLAVIGGAVIRYLEISRNFPNRSFDCQTPKTAATSPDTSPQKFTGKNCEFPYFCEKMIETPEIARKLSAGFTANLRGPTNKSWTDILGNRSIEFYSPVPFSELLDERIRGIARYTRFLKNGPLMAVSPLVLRLIDFLFSSKAQDFFLHVIAGDSYLVARSFQLSNVPGPSENRFLLGREISSITATVNLSQMFTAFSYRGKLRLVAALDENHIDSSLFFECFQKELAAL